MAAQPAQSSFSGLNIAQLLAMLAAAGGGKPLSNPSPTFPAPQNQQNIPYSPVMPGALFNQNQGQSQQGGGKGGNPLSALMGGKGGGSGKGGTQFGPLSLSNYGAGVPASMIGLGASDAGIASNLGSSMGDIGNLMSIYGGTF